MNLIDVNIYGVSHRGSMAYNREPQFADRHDLVATYRQTTEQNLTHPEMQLHQTGYIWT